MVPAIRNRIWPVTATTQKKPGILAGLFFHQDMNDEAKKVKDTKSPSNVDMTKDWRKDSMDKSKLLNKR